MDPHKLLNEIKNSLATVGKEKLPFLLDKVHVLPAIKYDPLLKEVCLQLSDKGFVEESENFLGMLTLKCDDFEKLDELKTQVKVQNTRILREQGKNFLKEAHNLSRKFLAERIRNADQKPNEENLKKIKKKVNKSLQDALTKFMRYLKLEQGNLEVIDLVIQTANELNDFDTAENFRQEKENILARLQTEKNIVEAEQAEQERVAAEEKIKAKGSEKDQILAELFEQADEALAKESFRSSLIKYSEILSKKPESNMAQIGKLKCLMGLRDYGTAKRTADFYIKKNRSKELIILKKKMEIDELDYFKDSAVRRLEKTILKTNTKKSEYLKIHKDLLKALELSPRDIEILDAMQTCLSYLGDTMQAEMLKQRMKSINPNYNSRFVQMQINKCFVVTSLFGPFSKEVTLMRMVRDQVLLKSLSGQVLVKLYYFFSPLFIDIIYSRPRLKKRLRSFFSNTVISFFTEHLSGVSEIPFVADDHSNEGNLERTN